MAKMNGKIPTSVRLKYKKGDLIIKEGDFGISIYKIISGKVGIFSQPAGTEIKLAELENGEVIGEMTFLNRLTARRSASARALEDTELEVWHPASLSKEYEGMPPILKYITNQALRRLIRMNKLLGNLTTKKKQDKERLKEKSIEPDDTQRRYYRKEIDRPCNYKPVDGRPNVHLTGQVKDLSVGGMGLLISTRNVTNFSHESGDEFFFEMVLPDGKEITGKMKIVSTRKDKSPGRIWVGMSFGDMNYEAKKRLGFFLMP